MPFIGSYCQLSLLTRFTVTGLALTIVSAGLVAFTIGRQIEHSMLEHDAWSVGESVSQALGPVISPSDFEQQPSAARASEIGTAASEYLVNGRIHGIQVWSADGTLIYSPSSDMLGNRYVLGPEAARALQGFPTFALIGIAANESTASESRRFGLQTFVPIRARDGQVLGVYEIQHYAGQLVGRIDQLQWTLLAGLVAGFGAIYVGLFGLVRRASEDLDWYDDELSRLEDRNDQDRSGTELAATVSHEIRAPLTSLLGYSELLVTRGPRSGPPREWAEHIHQQALRLTELVDEVLSAAIIEEGATQIDSAPVDVRSVVSRSISQLPRLSLAHTIESQLAPELPLALADRERLSQVLVNLISNAIKYSPDGGEIRVAAATINGAMRISVSDHGLGVVPEQLERIFDRFHRAHAQTHPDIGGTGLGLYIARRLVELQAGRIWAESAGPGLGTTVLLELPLAPASATRAPTPVRQTLAVGATH